MLNQKIQNIYDILPFDAKYPQPIYAIQERIWILALCVLPSSFCHVTRKFTNSSETKGHVVLRRQRDREMLSKKWQNEISFYNHTAGV